MFDFEKATIKLNGKFKKFEQIDYVKEMAKHFKEGACFAISILYLSRYAKGESDNNNAESDKMTFTAAVKDKKVRGIVSQIQQKENNRDIFANQCKDLIAKDIWELRNTINDMEAYSQLEDAKMEARDVLLKDPNLTNREIEQFMKDLDDLNGKIVEVTKKSDELRAQIKSKKDGFMQTFGRGPMLIEGLEAFGQKKKLIVNEEEFSADDTALEARIVGQPGRYVLGLPAHAVAAICDSKKCKFFDPNDGQAIFDNPEALKKFIRAFMSHADTKKSYELNKKKVALFGATI